MSILLRKKLKQAGKRQSYNLNDLIYFVYGIIIILASDLFFLLLVIHI